MLVKRQEDQASCVQGMFSEFIDVFIQNPDVFKSLFPVVDPESCLFSLFVKTSTSLTLLWRVSAQTLINNLLTESFQTLMAAGRLTPPPRGHLTGGRTDQRVVGVSEPHQQPAASADPHQSRRRGSCNDRCNTAGVHLPPSGPSPWKRRGKGELPSPPPLQRECFISAATTSTNTREESSCRWKKERWTWGGGVRGPSGRGRGRYNRIK